MAAAGKVVNLEQLDQVLSARFTCAVQKDPTLFIVLRLVRPHYDEWVWLDKDVDNVLGRITNMFVYMLVSIWYEIDGNQLYIL